MSETKLCLDIDDQAKYFVESTGCSVDQANLYIEGEEEYLASIGLSGYGTKAGEPALSEEEAAHTVVDQLDIENYIVEHKGLNRSLVECLSDAEYKYMESHGFFGEIPA